MKKIFSFCAAAEKCGGDNNMAACFKADNGSFINIAEVPSLQLKHTQKDGLVLKGKHKFDFLRSGENLLKNKLLH